MAKPHLKLLTPATKKRAVTPRRRPNSEFRSREHLTESEVEKLIEAAKDNRYGHRDATMILVAYRHGLRASEVCDLRWEQIDWNSATLHVRRVKSGKPSTHPIRGDDPPRSPTFGLWNEIAEAKAMSDVIQKMKSKGILKGDESWLPCLLYTSPSPRD